MPEPPLNRHFLSLALAAAFAAGGADATRAHAVLDHASPAAGSTVHAPPNELRIWFSDTIEPTFSSVAIADVSGRPIDHGKIEGDAEDPTELRVALSPLPPGTYRVTWRVFSADAHAAEGHFTFSVAP